jgi:hypothetical protein
MRAVWSFWSKPFKAHYHAVWRSPLDHLLSWVLSVHTARRHYPRTTLLTDDEGARLLADGLRLPFDEVSTGLNALDKHDPGWWALGKLHAYRAQTEPFVHIDNDVFLWQPLPEQITSAPVFAQNPEHFDCGIVYRPDLLERALAEGGSVWLPAEWVWYRAGGRRQRGECCGVFGGNRLDFIRHYAGQAIRLVEHPDNRPGWKLIDTFFQNVLCEQYLLAACVEYYRGRAASPFRGVGIRYLFDSVTEAFDSERAVQLGYTHLLSDAKRNREVVARLGLRVKRDYPDHYERCLSLGRPGLEAAYA